MVDSISSVALQGIQRGVESAVEAAEKITANAAVGEFQAEDFVQLSQSRQQVAASSKLFAVDREITKSVLDIIA